MNAVANQTMFQSAYRQISQPERSFVDRLVNLLAESAHRHEQSIRLALGQEMPDAVRRIDKKGWLDRPLVQAAITEEINRIADDQEISPQRWIKEVAAIAQSNVGEFYTVNALGQPEVDTDKLTDPDMTRAIKSIEFETSDNITRSAVKTKVKIIMHDKIAALKMQAAYMGLDDGENPHRRADRAAQEKIALPAGTTATEAGEKYARMIGDE